MILTISQKIPTNKRTTDFQECLVDVGTSFITNSKSSELVQPRKSSFDDPSVNAQAAAILRVASCKDRLNASLVQFIPFKLGIICPISLNSVRSFSWSANLSAHGGYRVNQRHQLGHIVSIGSRKNACERDALRVRNHMVLAAGFPPVRGIRADFRPPKTARTDALSTMARDQSICSAACSFANNNSWTFCHTPALCQACKYRQQDIPEPHPISLGSISHGIPVRNTNKMPVNAFRDSIGFRPGKRNLRGLGSGNSGSISAHNSSLRISRAICSTPIGLVLHMVYRYFSTLAWLFVRGS
jgi:hypothetical protein